MNVVIAADRNFRLQAAVFLASLRDAHPDGDVRVLLLHPDLDPVVQAALAEAAAPLRLEFVRMDVEALRTIRMPRRLSLSALLRLAIADLAPDGWEHALYLDVDMLVCDSLVPLWEQRTQVPLVGAVQDLGSPFFGSPKGPPYRDLGVAPSAPYFNSGVLLIDLAAWRTADVSRRSIALLEQHALPHADQCALNTVLEGRITPLATRWNTMSHAFLDHNHLAVTQGTAALEAVRRDAAILHFCTSALRRPWEDGCEHPEARRWVEQRDALAARLGASTFGVLAPAPPPRAGVAATLARRVRGLAARVLAPLLPRSA